jgi:hypothetical protein
MAVLPQPIGFHLFSSFAPFRWLYPEEDDAPCYGLMWFVPSVHCWRLVLHMAEVRRWKCGEVGPRWEVVRTLGAPPPPAEGINVHLKARVLTRTNYKGASPSP